MRPSEKNLEKWTISITEEAAVISVPAMLVTEFLIKTRTNPAIINTVPMAGVENASSCSMCKRLIINAGIETVVIRNTKDTYTVVNVRDWIYCDDTLGSSSY